MKKCEKCGHEQAAGKFCGSCGSEISESSGLLKCGSCGHEQASGKFCGRCGADMNASGPEAKTSGPPPLPSAGDASALPVTAGFLTWEISEIEVARRFTEQQLSFYDDDVINDVKGFIIGPHQRALIYSGGSLIAELASGTYDIPGRLDAPGGFDKGKSREGGLLGHLKGAGRFLGQLVVGKLIKSEQVEAGEQIKEAEKQHRQNQLQHYLEHIEEGKKAQAPLSLIITRSGSFNMDLTIDQVQTADVRTDIGLEVQMSMDDLEILYKEFLADTKDFLSKATLQSSIADRIGREVNEALASYSGGNIENNPEAIQALEAVIGPCIAPSFKVDKVGRVVVEHAEIQAIREENERLVLAEQRLPQLIAANEFASRLNVVDLEKAKSDEEFARALQEVNKDGLLRGEDMEVFQRTIREQREDHDVDREKTLGLAILARDHALGIAQQANQQAYEIAGLDHELDVTAKRRAFEREETVKDLDIDSKKRAFLRDEDESDDEADIRQLRRLQEVNNEKEDSELGRETARKRRDADISQAEREQFANMSPEQIMLIRPDLDPEVVKGWVEVQKAKSGSEHIEARATQTAEAAQREIEQNRAMTDRMQQFMENQMDTLTNLASGQASAKDKEIDRIQKSASETEERLSNVVGNTVDAFKGSAAEATVKGSQQEPGAAETLYNVAVGKDDKGRHSLSAIAQQIAAGEFDPQSKVWSKGMDNWSPAVQVPEIADLMDHAPPPILDEEDGPPPL